MAKIVYCEDEALIQKLVTVMLRSTPHELYIASDGLQGLALIERERPDLVFTDISMPRCDGLQLAEKLKSQPDLAHIPLIFVTAFAMRVEIENGYRHGAVSYLVKPFTAADLYEKIETFCNIGTSSHVK